MHRRRAALALRGINPNGSIEFGMRSDEVVTKAMLNLEYTPSPSVTACPVAVKGLSQPYELMGVLPVTKQSEKNVAQMPINPLVYYRLQPCTARSLSAIIRTCAKTRPAPRFGRMLGEQWTGSHHQTLM
ncbi:cellulose biosynthesis cyclic di-GMP-binding regulatory protein BcsB [Escherichia coli]